MGCCTNDRIRAQTSTNIEQTKAFSLISKFKNEGAREMDFNLAAFQAGFSRAILLIIALLLFLIFLNLVSNHSTHATRIYITNGIIFNFKY